MMRLLPGLMWWTAPAPASRCHRVVRRRRIHIRGAVHHIIRGHEPLRSIAESQGRMSKPVRWRNLGSVLRQLLSARQNWREALYRQLDER